MTSQNFPRKPGNESSNSAIYPRKRVLTFKKWIFMSRIVLLDPKLTHVNFSNFQAEQHFSFSKFLGRLDEKRAAATPLIDQFAKICPKGVLRMKTKSHQLWAS